MDNEFIFFDRLEKIKSVIKKYGEENFAISFSGGKDSTVLSEIVDMAMPGNEIPRVYADTGIEYGLVRKFVLSKKEKDDRFVILKPTKNIRKTLEEVGYPFKSKEHSAIVEQYQRSGFGKSVTDYLGTTGNKKPRFRCPDILRYQFTESFTMKLSDKCCSEVKKKPLAQWQKENGKSIMMVGVRRAEGGRRVTSKCLVFKKGNEKDLKKFQPLAPVEDDFVEWFIDSYNIEISDIYLPPYNLKRTGCKGCPFCVELETELAIIKQAFPNEYKQCEMIWKPVYDEYRRIGYRLKDIKEQISFEDL